jgi:alpha-L-fucosidase
MWIMDFANDDDFSTSWMSNSTVKRPWHEIDFGREKPFNTITIYEQNSRIRKYHIEYYEHGVWKTLLTGSQAGKAKIHRFDRVWGDKVKIVIDEFSDTPSIAEVGVYNERR